MAITALQGTSLLEGLVSEKTTENKKTSNTESFEALLNSAMGMIKETEHYTNLAEEAELSYMLGLNDSVTDLLVAQIKANTSLQYTVAVRNAVLDAYKEIMNLQF
ncbi:MAG: flagellar hook-basal body complex protein FliE [Lachnospiraceae bacterium]